MRKFLTIFMSTVIVLIFVSEASAKINRGFNKVVELTTTEANNMWRNFSNARIAGDYVMSFTITHSPRRGENVEYVGELFGTRVGDGTLTRIRVKKAFPADAPISDFILSNSKKNAKVWKASGNKFEEIDKKDWFKPLIDGLIFSPFDLLMPYVNWQHKYVGGGRIGQAVHFFELSPADDEIANGSKKVRIAITREFNSPAQTDIFDKNGILTKTVALGSVKKFDGLWLIKEISARDEISRDKDKLKFNSAAVNVVIPHSVFDPNLQPTQPIKPDLKKL